MYTSVSNVQLLTMWSKGRVIFKVKRLVIPPYSIFRGIILRMLLMVTSETEKRHISCTEKNGQLYHSIMTTHLHTRSGFQENFTRNKIWNVFWSPATATPLFVFFHFCFSLPILLENNGGNSFFSRRSGNFKSSSRSFY